MKNLKIFFVAAFVVSALACAGTSPTNSVASNANAASPVVAATMAPTPDETVVGRALYNQNCAACHKEDGTGGKMTIEGKTLDVDDLTSEKIKMFSDEKIRGYIENGVEDEGMPAFKGRLSGEEIWEVIRYVRTGIQNKPVYQDR